MIIRNDLLYLTQIHEIKSPKNVRSVKPKAAISVYFSILCFGMRYIFGKESVDAIASAFAAHQQEGFPVLPRAHWPR